MFTISVQSGGPEELFGTDGAYRIIKEAGFDGVDANVDHLFSYGDIVNRKVPYIFAQGSDQDVLDAFTPWRDAAKKYGLTNFQAHAPFPSYVFDEGRTEYNDLLLGMLEKIIMGCDSMDCRKLVIHPFFLPYDRQVTPREEWDTNIERYSRLIGAAKKYGVTICLENMFVGFRGKIYGACCSDIATACQYIDTLNGIAGEKVFGFCLDTGHLLLLGKDVKNAMVQLGDRIEAFHVHDNDGVADQHLAPYMGVLDWKRFAEGLKAIGWHKNLSFETFNIWNRVDPEIAPDFLRAIADTGRMFARKAEA